MRKVIRFSQGILPLILVSLAISGGVLYSPLDGKGIQGKRTLKKQRRGRIKTPWGNVPAFNFQRLDSTFWKLDPRMGSLQSSRSLHYAAKFYFIPSLDSFKVERLEGKLELWNRIPGYTMRFATVDSIPMDSYLQINVGENDEGAGYSIRLSAFKKLKSGIFQYNSRGMMSRVPTTSPRFPTLPVATPFHFSIHFDAQQRLILQISTQHKKRQVISQKPVNPAGKLSMISGQWPIRLRNLIVQWNDQGGEKPSTHEHQQAYRSAWNPLDNERHFRDLPTLDKTDTVSFASLLFTSLFFVAGFMFFTIVQGFGTFVSLWMTALSMGILLCPWQEVLPGPPLTTIIFLSFLFMMVWQGESLCVMSFIEFRKARHLRNTTPQRSTHASHRIQRRVSRVLINWILFVCTLSLAFTTLIVWYSQMTQWMVRLPPAGVLLGLIWYPSLRSKEEKRLNIPLILCSLLLLFEIMVPSQVQAVKENTGLGLKRMKRQLAVWKHDKSRLRGISLEKPKGVVRIMAMGGSSTYGFPYLDAAIPWPGVLQRLLEVNGGRGKIEVLNAGLNGYTSFLMKKAYESTLFKYQPDILILDCRFNDSTTKPRWFTAFPQLTDARAWQRLHWIATHPRIVQLQRLLSRLTTYRSIRATVLALRRHLLQGTSLGTTLPPRGTVEEFRANLRDFLRLAQKNHCRLIFLPEPNQYTLPLKETVHLNPYINAMVQIAAKHHIPLVDAMTPLAARPDDYLFVDYIHPSVLGHEEIALAVYHTLVTTRWLPLPKRALLRSQS